MVSSPPPEQETEAPKRYIPPEIIEEIFLNLPIKSLLRFSCASTSWKSTITSSQFAAKHVGGRKIVIMNDSSFYFGVRNAFCSPLSTISDPPVGNTTSSTMLVCPFRAVVKLKAFCDELWCVLVNKSLYLWNPSTGAHKKLPDMMLLHTYHWDKNYMDAYGLGYDAVDDDYKLLKIWNYGDFFGRNRTFLYSLKKGVWREIVGKFPKSFPNSNGLFVNGALNWMVIREFGYMYYLITFDFSTEKYRVLKQPAYLPELKLRSDVVDVAVLGSKLCVFVNYRRCYQDNAFVLWAMEDYGVVESWTKLYDIRYESIPPIVSEFRKGTWFTLRPLYLYEDGRVVIWASCGSTEWDIIVYKDMKVVAHSKIVPRSKAVAISGGTKPFPTWAIHRHRGVCGGFVYVESFASSMKLAALGQ